MSKKKNETDDQRIAPFAAWLRTTNRGRTHEDLSEALHQLTAKVIELGKAGELTLKIKVSPLDADSGQLKVTESVSTKLPQPDPKASIFWADQDGNLARNDPNQLAFGDIHAAPETVVGEEVVDETRKDAI